MTDEQIRQAFDVLKLDIESQIHGDSSKAHFPSFREGYKAALASLETVGNFYRGAGDFFYQSSKDEAQEGTEPLYRIKEKS